MAGLPPYIIVNICLGPVYKGERTGRLEEKLVGQREGWYEREGACRLMKCYICRGMCHRTSTSHKSGNIMKKGSIYREFAKQGKFVF